MREDYALRYLQRLVPWPESTLENEVGWLRRISAYKFDSYQDFVAGERFISALIRWLNQFDEADRGYAYDLLRKRITFVSAPEIQHLVRRTVPAHFRPIWIQRIARELKIAPYEVWATQESVAAYKRLVRRSLFIGLSDGARMDVFRRANVGVVSNEQVAVTYELSSRKLSSLVNKLRKDENSKDAKFEMVFLIDDFLGSGTTLCRQEEDGAWEGKIQKFGEAINVDCKACFAENFEIATHHYIATTYGFARAQAKLAEFAKATTNEHLKGRTVRLTTDLRLTDEYRFPKKTDPALDTFLQKYYDPEIMSNSLSQGGSDVQNGFADGGLTLVLEHNTPNNSLAIIWAESGRKWKGHEMRPLFMRRQRHS